MVRILVTGFEPFGEHAENISSQIVEALPQQIQLEDPWSALRENKKQSLQAIIETRILTVDEAGSLHTSSAVEKGDRWDAILHLGLCESCQIPRIETLARDHLDMRIPDNSGRQVSNQVITGEGSLPVTVPAESWMSLPWSLECELSQDAGSYLCNETLYQTLRVLHKISRVNEIMPPCLFVHFPDVVNCSIQEGLEFTHEVLERMMFRPVLSVVGALITRGESYLVAQRSTTEKHAGKWEFPGGKVESNETHPFALEREMDEEFGWQVRCGNSIGTWYHSLEKIDIALHILPTDFIGIPPDFTDMTLWTAHEAICWRNLDDTSKLDWLGNDGAVVQWMKETNYLAKSK